MFVRGSQVTLERGRGWGGMERVMSGNWLCSEPKPRQAEAGAILEVWHNQLDCHCNAKLANARSAMTLGCMPGREVGGGRVG